MQVLWTGCDVEKNILFKEVVKNPWLLTPLGYVWLEWNVKGEKKYHEALFLISDIEHFLNIFRH